MLRDGSRRVGLVGAGLISAYHVAALRRIPGIEIVGIFDLDRAKAEAAADRYGIPVAPSLAALRALGADVIHVMTPPATHARVALEALELGCHLFVEKPLATDVQDAERVRDRARDKGLVVGVCHSLLYDPQVRRALAAVQRGELGRLVAVDVLRSSIYPPTGGGPLPPQYSSAGYPFRDLGIHALYLIEAFLGPIESVKANWASLGGDPNLAFDEWRALLRCRDGLGQVQLSWNARPVGSQIILQGTKGTRRVDLFLMFQATRAATSLPKPVERLVNAATDSLRPLWDVSRNAVAFASGAVRPYHGLQDLVAAFHHALTTGERPPVTADDAIAPVRWTEQVARAAEEDFHRRVHGFQSDRAVPFLVTGASGGLGSALVDRLRQEGHRVRVFVRRLPEHVPSGVEIAVGDLGDADAVDRAVTGAQCVFHVGAAMKGSREDHLRATVAGTQNVVSSCLKHGVSKLVHVSSLSVVDWASGTPLSPIDEQTALERRPEERGIYTQAKLEAECLVRKAVAEAGLPAVIVRPGQIFGGRIPLLTPAVARRLGSRWLALGSGNTILPLVYIDDVVDALCLAAKANLKAGEVIQIVDPEPLTQSAVLQAALGDGAPVVRVPRLGLIGAAGAIDALLGLVGKKSPVSRYRIQSALANRRFDSERARQLLGWQPRVGVREGIRRVRDAASASTLANARPNGGSASVSEQNAEDPLRREPLDDGAQVVFTGTRRGGQDDEGIQVLDDCRVLGQHAG